MDLSQHQKESAEIGQDNVFGYPVSDNHPNGFGAADLSPNGHPQNDGFDHQIPEQRVEEDTGLEDDEQTDEAPGVTDSNGNDEQEEEAKMQDHEEGPHAKDQAEPADRNSPHVPLEDSRPNEERHSLDQPQESQYPDHQPWPGHPSHADSHASAPTEAAYNSPSTDGTVSGPEVVMTTPDPDEAALPTAQGEDGPAQTTSTPAKGQRPPSTSTPRTLKDKISAIPARLSRFSLLNALRSGSYVVSEPKMDAPANAQDTERPEQRREGEDHDHRPPEEEDDEEEEQTGTTVRENVKEPLHDNGGVLEDSRATGNRDVPLTKMDGCADAELGETHIGSSGKCRRKSVHRSALTKLMCGLYAVLLVVFGIVFAVANALTVKERQHFYYLEVFLVYLYAGSLAVLLYFQLCILRGVRVRNHYFDNSIRVVIRRDQDNLQLTPGPTRKQHDLLDNQQHHVILDGDETLDSRKLQPLDQMSTLSTRSQMAAPADGEVAHVGEGINFYLRLGCLAFSIGSVTLDGFHIASYFETDNTTTCESFIFTVVYVLHLIFTFIQTFFLFKNHKLVIDKNKASVRFGLMHLLATNIAVWFVTAITETAEDYKQQAYFTAVAEGANRTGLPKSCYEDVTLARTASPYLFPCTIIYSIIAAGIIYRMYQYVGVKVTQRWPSHTSLTSSVPAGAVGMDCEKANKGLFSGLLIAVITLIAIATFFVFESRLDQPTSAIKIFFVMEISLILITGSCILLGMFRFMSLKFLDNYRSLDAVLLVISLGGCYVYLSFMLISSASMVARHGVIAILSLAAICVGLLESTLQAIFILDGLSRRAENDAQVESKPGRAVVTFLLVCNLALWVVSMFEIRKTMVVPFHMQFYGILPWNIMLHLCVPLFIYFRFHSAICLSKIWYHAYQKDRSL